jgi:hypothetical protein
VPTKTRAAGSVDLRNAGAGDFDCGRRLSAPYRQSEILGFYLAQWENQGWKLWSRGTSSGSGHGAQLLFQRAGSDTFYWIAGVTVVHHSATETTWSVRYYQSSTGI